MTLMTPAFCHVTQRQTSLATGLRTRRHAEQELNHAPVFVVGTTTVNSISLLPPQNLLTVNKERESRRISRFYALAFCNTHTVYRRPVSRTTNWETQLPCAGTLRMWRQDGVCRCPYLLIPY